MSASELDSDVAIAGESAGAGENQVAKPGQTGHSFLTAAASDHQASHFRQAARDQGGDRVVAKSQAMANSGGDGDGIFQRSAKFDADDVFIACIREIADR